MGYRASSNHHRENPSIAFTRRSKAPRTSARCLQEAMAFLDQSRLLIEQASCVSTSATDGQLLRRLAIGFIGLRSPLNRIAGKCEEGGPLTAGRPA